MATLKTLLIAMNAALMATALFTPPAPAQDTDVEPERFTNRNILRMAENERSVWLHGLVLGLASGIALRDQNASDCVAAWYFENEQQHYATVIANLERFPDHVPPTVVLALARRECPQLRIDYN
ncbi:hypothetical protein [Woodsholea maritima]|uniref:hypothetical protein n=1 Tax=Woodsholea maritima TaxID=240237 RepID=UPI00037BB3D2|nr:hypothetical protein [Woodsholea maritima]